MKKLKNLIAVSAIIAITCSVKTDSAMAKSVYAITEHHVSKLKAYKITGDQLAYQADVNVTNYATGAVGLAIDSNLQRLFITYEDAGKVVWANAKTLNQEGFVDIRDWYVSAGELAGIVVDEQKQRVYVVERENNKLYILAWNAAQQHLVLMDPDDPNQPYSGAGPAYAVLTDLEPGTGAWGTAFDENTRRLYVANNTANVHYYDVDDPNWTHLGSRDVGRAVADIVVDPNNGEHNAYLYGGALYTGYGGGHDYLIKHDLECDTGCNTETDIGTVAIAVAVDIDTSLVYVNTLAQQLRVYDCSQQPFELKHSVETGAVDSAGAGLCVPTGDVEYKPGLLILTKADDVNGFV